MTHLRITLTGTALTQCRTQSREFLASAHAVVETGGVLAGQFDGETVSPQALLFDKKAICRPASIELSPDVFGEAERLASVGEGEAGWHLLGTWHTHPPGFPTYSTMDVLTLFREQMRLRTDDPSLATAPWVHLIFPDYGLSDLAPRAFTLQLQSAYEAEAMDRSHAIDVCDLERATSSGVTLGLILGDHSRKQNRLAEYHPAVFQRHHKGETEVVGLWRHYNVHRVVREFEKVFLENFFRQRSGSKFLYVRSLLGPRPGTLDVEAYRCYRKPGPEALHEIVKYVELPVEDKAAP